MVRTYQGDLGVQAHLEALLQRKALVEVSAQRRRELCAALPLLPGALRSRRIAS